MFTLRPATVGDAAAIAHVHVEAWRTTYRGLIPDSFLDALSPERRIPVWERRFSQPEPDFVVYVAENEDGVVVGFADGGHTRDAELAGRYSGELYAIYLLPEARAHGVGARLMRAVAEALATHGMRSLLVWVLATNPARAFYERLGGRFVREAPIEIGGAALVEVAYGWDEPTAGDLIARG